SNHRFRWSGAVGGAHSAPGGGTAGDDDVNTASMATVRIPADADDGDTIDVSVTVTDDTRISVTTEIQLLVGENAQPTASGVRGTDPDGDGPSPKLLRINDGFQNQKDGSTVTIRGVGYDADGESLLYNWSEIDLATQEPDEDPKLELQGSFTDTVSFEVPELESGGENLTVFLNMTVIDPNGAFATDGVLITIVNDDDAPDADAGDDEQVDPEDFVRLNGSGSSDADIGDKISYRWDYLGATMDPAPDERSPLSADEIDELKGWILPQDFTGTTVETSDYIVTGGGQLKDGVTGLTNLKSTSSPYPYFDAPDLTGFNNIKLTFRLHVKDSGGTDIDGDDATTTADVTSLDEADVDADLDGNGDKDGTEIAMVKESILGLDLNNDGDAEDEINLGASNCGADGESSCAANEANVAAVDSDMVTITVVNRFFSGNISGPGSCTEMSLGGPQTYAFDSDDDGVADICALNTTRRATVARQNALETLAGLNPVEFRTEVLAVCGEAGFKQKDYDDDPSDLETDVCETERVTPPPAAADPATADVFFSGTVTGLDYCTNHSLGGARLYAFDSDGDGVADVCSLPTTRREAIARQSALETFISAPFTNQTELDFLKYLAYIHDLGADRNDAQDAEYAKFAGEFEDGLASHNIAGITQDDSLNPEELGHLNGTVDLYEDQKSRAGRYSNALAAACRALGSQDFGDSASALARDECVPTPTTGEPLG
ncbi:hypothetical protein, partial [Candidatus Poriferisocius sp.]|uniref:hypothetical protein n=1 Tax=Candidatus Poriferisocius sp. TaxID=3101276 RepID=UPI003B526652